MCEVTGQQKRKTSILLIEDKWEFTVSCMKGLALVSKNYFATCSAQDFFIAVISLIIHYEFCIFFQYVTQWLPSHVLGKSEFFLKLIRHWTLWPVASSLTPYMSLIEAQWSYSVWICEAYSHSEALEHSVPFALNALPKYISITCLYASSLGSNFTLPLYPL